MTRRNQKRSVSHCLTVLMMCCSVFGHLAGEKRCEGQRNKGGACAGSIDLDFDQEQGVNLIAARDITFDGSCGTWSGKTCAEGFCCSSLNYCGNSEDHCGYGCQPGFGTCHEQVTNSSKQTSQAESDLPVETGGNDAVTKVSVSSPSESPSPTNVNEFSESSAQVSACPLESTGTIQDINDESDDTYAQDGVYIKTFKGKGMVSTEGWPSKDKWLSFEKFWKSNLGIMRQSCQNWNESWAQNSETEIATMKSSIEEVATETNLDKTFIAAIMMQESNGCTRVHTTYGSHPNPGLFQSHNGTGSCNDQPSGPCPQAEILQMVKDGAAGTTQGDGLKQCLEKSKGGTGVIDDEATYYYQAARRYNSGSLASDGDLGRKGATPCYCSDVANRLIGWSKGTSGCTSEAIL